MHEPTTTFWAEYYATRYGWKLFPVHGVSLQDGCTCPLGKDCKNAGKHPANADGFKSATDAVFVLGNWFEKGDRNIGLATGRPSGVFVVDVDGPEGEAALKGLQEAHGRLPETLQSSTGRGRHIFFKSPSRGKISNSAGKLGPKLDVRGDGGYVILPPSHHATGAQYRWVDKNAPLADAPAWLVEALSKQAESSSRPEEFLPADDLSARELSEAQSALNSLDPDMGYDDWYRVGMALHAMGAPFDLWDEWSSRGQKYNGAEMAAKWASFEGQGIGEGTLWRMAEEGGWKSPSAKRVAETLDLEPPAAPDFAATALSEPQLRVSPASMPGLIGETVNWILTRSIRPQPEVTLLAVLGAVAGVVGRKYESEIYGTRPNVYLCSIAPSASGKDAARKAIVQLFSDANIEKHLGDQAFVSARGLLNSVYAKPSQIMLVDEMGHVLDGMSNPRAAAYKVELKSLLLEMFSSSGGRVTGGTYADAKKEPISIYNPALSVYGTATEKTYASALTPDMVESGELNRWIVLASSMSIPPRNRQATNDPAPERVRAGWMKLAAIEPPKGEGDITDAEDPDRPSPPIKVRWSDEAREALHAYEDMMDNTMQVHLSTGMHALFGRAVEQAMKLAMLFAICRDAGTPEIQKEDLALARQIVDVSTHYLLWTTQTNMSDATPRAKTEMKVEDAIRKAGPDGCPAQDLARAVRGTQRSIRDDAVSALIEQAKIRPVIRDQVRYFVHAENWAAHIEKYPVDSGRVE